MTFYSEIKSIKVHELAIDTVHSAICSVDWGCECVRSFFDVISLRFDLLKFRATVDWIREEFLFFYWPLMRCTAHESIRSGQIALNAIQRRHARVSSGDSISVSRLFNTNLCLSFNAHFQVSNYVVVIVLDLFRLIISTWRCLHLSWSLWKRGIKMNRYMEWQSLFTLEGFMFKKFILLFFFCFL
jgi:hypothetical protein